MHRKKLLVVLLGGVLMFAGCASMTTLQNAEVLEPGRATYYAAYVPTTIPEFIDVDTNGKYDPMDFNTIEVGGRLGLFKNFDVGAKVYPIGTLLDGKYQFLNSGMIKGAGDLGVGYMTITSGSDSSESKSSTTVIDMTPMVLFTVKPISFFSFTVAPKTLIRMQMPDEGSSSFKSLFGATAMAKFHVGSLGALSFEYGMFGGSYNTTHFALAAEKNISFGD